MVSEINFLPGQIRPIEPPPSAPASKPGAPVEGSSFGEILQEKVEEVRLSAHAEKRLASRNIQLSEQDMSRLKEGVSKVEAKGGRDSLVLMDQTAFVVSVPNRTVVTAVDAESMQDTVFTNIDSAVIV